MKTIPAFALLAALGFTGCYTQLYTQGYADRAVEGPQGYAQSPRDEADTALTGDSSQAAQARDTLYRPAPVIVNNYYQDQPYYRGYRVDEWEYPLISFGFYSSRYRDYNGAYWWSDPWYRDRHRGGGYNGGYNGNHPSAGGGTPGPYTSDKRIFTTTPDRPAKGHRSSSYTPPPAPKRAEDDGSNSSSSGSSQVSGGNSSSGSSSSSSSGSSSDSKAGSSQKEDRPKVNKGRRR